MAELIERVYQAFDPAEPAVENETYVNLDDVRGKADVVARLAKRIGWPDGTTCHLLAGHRGSGKTTELRRLEKRLSEGEKPYFVVYVNSSADLDLNDVGFPEILIAMMRRLVEELETRESIRLKPGYFRDRLREIKSLFLSDVEFDKIDVGVSLLKLSTKIRSSPDAREELRKELQSHTSSLLQAANDLISEAMPELTKKGYTNIVIIMDDLDRIVLRPHKDADCSTAEYLFVHQHSQLTGFACHVVYTMPLMIVYSAQGAKITSLYGVPTPVVPMTKIRKKPPGLKSHKPGVDRFREIIANRLKNADAAEQDVFGKGVIKKLIELSGGQPRELMMLVREALIGDDLPVGMAAVNRVAKEGALAYARLLMDEHWGLIRQVAESGKLRRVKADEEAFRELLDTRAVLQYVNDDGWFGVNPLISVPAPKRKKK